MAKRFINAAVNVVPDLMQGLSLDSSRVTLLDPATGHNVAIRASLAANKQTPRVSVVSGGGSGHEPMAAGYVGEGMLAAAVAGGVFASPSVADITAMLEAVAPRSTAILIVVMNYQGDRLNFDMAKKELLRKSPGYPIHMMLVADDVALLDVDAQKRRGVAGTVFVLKAAGSAADQGRPFQEVVNIAEMAARSIVSYGIALEPCTIPGHSVDDERLNADEIELGMGIHGEPGAERQLLSQIDNGNLTRDLVSIIGQRLDGAMQMKTDLAPHCTSLAVMVNNLGAVSQAELLIVCKAVSDFVFNGNGGVLNGNMLAVHMFVGSFMTSLQMNGVSVTCFMLPSDNGLMEKFLHSRTECSAWNAGFQLLPPAQRNVVPRVMQNVAAPHVGQAHAAGGAQPGYQGAPPANMKTSRPVQHQQQQQYGGAAPPRPSAQPLQQQQGYGGAAPARPQGQPQQQQPQQGYGGAPPARPQAAAAQQQYGGAAPTRLQAQAHAQQQQAYGGVPPRRAQAQQQQQQQQQGYGGPAPQYGGGQPMRPAQAQQQFGRPLPQRPQQQQIGGGMGGYAGVSAQPGTAGTVTGLSPTTEMTLLRITSALQNHSGELTVLDRKTGDGDFGDTVNRGCSSIRSDLEQGRYAAVANNPSELFRAIARSTESMGGTSGVLTQVFLLEAADAYHRVQRDMSPEQAWRAAFVAGTNAVMQQGKAKVGDRTLVDALKPAADVLEAGSGSIADAAHAARVGYESTKSMTTAKFGRSVHVRADKLLNQPDPGALAICLILDALGDGTATSQDTGNWKV